MVIEGLNALGDMFIRHNALNMMKNMNNSRQVIEAIEQGFHLIAQMIDSRVSRMREGEGSMIIVIDHSRF